MSGLASSRAGSLPQLTAFQCGSEPARDEARPDATETPQRPRSRRNNLRTRFTNSLTANGLSR
ncbi:hypothetical protein EAH72_26645 [Pseudomonas caspiana]|nr:hypothetical protein EAH72_26645 [Pseudomonas caspiana]